MLEILQFVFSSFWKFWGSALLLGIVASAFSGLIKIVINRK